MPRQIKKNSKPKKPVAAKGENHPASATEEFKAWASDLVNDLAPEVTPAELEVMRSQMNSLNSTMELPDLPRDPAQPTIVRERKTLDELAAAIDHADDIVIDLETSDLDQRSGVIVGVGLAFDGQSYYIPTQHRFEETNQLRPNQLPLAEVLEVLKLEDKKLIAHNSKFELKWLRQHNNAEFEFKWDTMLAARLLRPDQSAELKDVAARELDVPNWELSKADMKRIEFLPIERVAAYCAKDCWYTLRIYQQQVSQDLNDFLMREVEMPLVEIVATMEENGYKVDTKFFSDLRAEIEPEQERLLNRIKDDTGNFEFNPNSSTQLQDLFFNQLGEKSTKKTKGGKPSVDKEVLTQLAKKHPVAQLLLDYRSLEKLITTYCGIPEKLDNDQRLRVNFNQLDAETGRFSSRSVIQTIPKNNAYGIRNGFRAEDGSLIVTADYVQQELIVLADVSGDKNMQRAAIDGVDLHGLAAVKVYQLECQPNEVKARHDHLRDQIKAIQFGLIYGKTAYSLATDLSITKEQAEALRKDYFKQFPSVNRFIQEIHKQVTSNGFVDDVFGRRRYFPDGLLKPQRQQRDQNKKIFSRIGQAKRGAQNFVIQRRCGDNHQVGDDQLLQADQGTLRIDGPHDSDLA